LEVHPSSPDTSLNLLDAHPDLDAGTLHTIAKGLAITIKNREALYQRIHKQCKDRITELEEKAKC
jgi:hypothetical protein